MTSLQDLDLITNLKDELFIVCGNYHPDNKIRIITLSQFNQSFSTYDGMVHNLHISSSGLKKLYIERKNIKRVIKPQQFCNDLLNQIHNQNPQKIENLSEYERKNLEIVLNLSENFKIPPETIGITGNGVFKKIDLEETRQIIIYGQKSFQQIQKKYDLLPTNSKKLKPWLKIDILPIAEYLESLSSSPFVNCFELIFKQPRYLLYKNQKLLLHYVPNIKNRKNIEDKEFQNNQKKNFSPKFQDICHIIITAMITSFENNFFYPGILEIKPKSLQFLDKGTSIDINSISIVQIQNRNLLHIGKPGDMVKIAGLLQKEQKIGSDDQNNPEISYRIQIGSINSDKRAEYLVTMQDVND